MRSVRHIKANKNHQIIFVQSLSSIDQSSLIGSDHDIGALVDASELRHFVIGPLFR